MIELLVMSALALVAVVVFGALASVAALVCWLIFLPFRLLGLIFRGFAFVLLLPLLLLAGVVGVAFFGFGLLVFLVPLLPFALATALIVWLMKRRHPARPIGA